jgi:hypothetical protein
VVYIEMRRQFLLVKAGPVLEEFTNCPFRRMMVIIQGVDFGAIARIKDNTFGNVVAEIAQSFLNTPFGNTEHLPHHQGSGAVVHADSTDMRTSKLGLF